MRELIKKLILLSTIIIIFTLSTTILYSTYATGDLQQNENYTFDLRGDNVISMPRYSYKTVIYQVKSTNPGTVKYGVSFSTESNDIRVKAYTDSDAPAQGTITRNERKYIKLRIENYSNDTQTVELKTILGFENGGNLVVPSGETLVSSTTTGEYTLNSATNQSYFYISTLTRENIESIEYTKLSYIPANTTTTNISSDNSVRLWYELNEETNRYKVYIGSITGKFKAPATMQYMFLNLTNVTNLDLKMIDTSNVTEMTQLFANDTNLRTVDVSTWKTPKVAYMSTMFNGCSSLIEADLSSFTSESLRSIQTMFNACSSLNKVDFSNLDFTPITSYANAFRYAKSSVQIIVKDCEQYNIFVSKIGTKPGLRTVNNDSCST